MCDHLRAPRCGWGPSWGDWDRTVPWLGWLFVRTGWGPTPGTPLSQHEGFVPCSYHAVICVMAENRFSHKILWLRFSQGVFRVSGSAA